MPGISYSYPCGIGPLHRHMCLLKPGQGRLQDRRSLASIVFYFRPLLMSEQGAHRHPILCRNMPERSTCREAMLNSGFVGMPTDGTAMHTGTPLVLRLRRQTPRDRSG
jgi:hypothetical protein